MVQWTWNGGPNEEWYLLAAGDADPALYTVYNVPLPNASPLHHCARRPQLLHQQQYRHRPVAFHWRAQPGVVFVPLADGNDLIVNAYSGLALGDPGYSTCDGTPIIQWQVNGGQNEEWQVYDQGNGYVAIVNAYSQMVLADPGDPTSDGTPSSSSSGTAARTRNGNW